MSLRALIEASAQKLTDAKVSFGHGTANALDEAAWLVLFALGLPLDTDLDTPDSAPLNEADSCKVQALIDQRIITRKPAAYLTHEAWLQGVSFYVDERVIVPRSLIAELLVNGSLDYWLQASTQRVLDLCTGNASLAIIAAMVYPEVQVEGADISTDALDVARINVERHQLGDRITLIPSDGVHQLRGPYDLILCNPPYVNATSMASLPPEYRAEPALALDGNIHGSADGMDFVRDLLQGVAQYMSESAVLVLEIGHERPFFEAAFPELEAVWLETSAGDDQVVLLTRQSLLQ
jgi:ribosomal protein L3 glutamine methyltransferase